MALKQIKNKIISTKKTGKVTKAMESVSAVKMRKSQLRAFASRPYVHTAMRILVRLAQTNEVKQHSLSLPRQITKKLVIIVTSDKGLAGSVNSAVLKQVEQMRLAGDVFDVLAIGRRALEFAKREKLMVVADYLNVSDNVALADVYKMSEVVMKAFTNNNEYGKVEIVYQNFISTFEQLPTKRQILPLDPAEVHFIMRGIRPKTGKFSEEVVAPDAVVQYEIEPNVGTVLDILIPQLVQILLFHALLESKASEHSARMVAMKNATDKSQEIIKVLTLMYNKARQAAITAEVAEITGGMEAMK
ncbi:ATP synthase F1 subunit gamma [Candidatus Kaiserbacteria bacterium CG_4_8_14_3_um_filter_38_9]|uniref:ATP synthase gamma chain n=1 Tax=Candidatus Kaiserbacteria bacterium CG_4_8_14_3_um_filter_38_9 TaxID=1974599 RepID=A0A2M7INM5_9BACT|nr:MAG: ATP synthase F1 subunit gamma [Candidatus Kaiserbacteria bacterium CG_4_8_14_3_um_filter_38_9]